MADISRRRFLRDASIGAAAVGAATAAGRQGLASLTGARSASGGPLGAGAAFAAGPRQGAGPGRSSSQNGPNEVMAHVMGGPAGTVEIYSGTRLVTLHDPSVANALISALG
jgi:hypothetical protein